MSLAKSSSLGYRASTTIRTLDARREKDTKQTRGVHFAHAMRRLKRRVSFEAAFLFPWNSTPTWRVCQEELRCSQRRAHA